MVSNKYQGDVLCSKSLPGLALLFIAMFKINIITNPQVEAGMSKAFLLVNGTTIVTIDIEQVEGNISDKTDTKDFDDHAFVEEAKKDK